jgi:hypothetical protein
MTELGCVCLVQRSYRRTPERDERLAFPRIGEAPIGALLP